MQLFLAAFLGYFFGSVSFAVLVSRWHGVNILEMGSRNPGATNVKRSVGKRAGNLVFLLDFLKGVLAAGWPLVFLEAGEHLFYVQLVGLIGALAGHSFSIFLKFKGGKGVATAMGGLLAIVPLGLGLGIGVWLVLFYAFRYVSVASIGFGLFLPIGVYFVGGGIEKVIFCTALGLFIVVRHKVNIKRLLRGEESRFSRRK